MSHIPDSEKNRARQFMEVGLLTRMLFGGGNPAPAVVETHVQHSLVYPETGRILTQVYLAVTWAGFDCAFPGITVRPDTEDEGATRVLMRVSRRCVWEQLQHACNVIGCTNVVFSPDDDPNELGGGGLKFMLPASVTRILRGAA